MKNYQIVFNVIKKHSLSILLVFFLFVFVILNFAFAKPVFASEYIAVVNMSVNVRGDDEHNISNKNFVLSENAGIVQNVQNLDVQIGAREQLEFCFEVCNITSGMLALNFEFLQGLCNNMNFICTIDDVACDCFNANFSIMGGQSAVLKFCCSVDKIARDANLTGDVCLSVVNLSGV